MNLAEQIFAELHMEQQKLKSMSLGDELTLKKVWWWTGSSLHTTGHWRLKGVSRCDAWKKADQETKAGHSCG